MTETDKAWLAGMVDGEGTISYTVLGRGEHRSPGVSVASTTRALIDKCHTIAGGRITSKRTYKEGHSPSWAWRTSRDHAIEIFTQILPYMAEPEKIRRVELLVTRWKLTVCRNGRYTEGQLEAKRDLEALFFANSRKR